MGEIAEMMLDGTMDCETGEWNFDGEDGPGFPMTGAEARAYKRATSWKSGLNDGSYTKAKPVYRLTKAWRKKIEAFGSVANNDAWHWQVRKDGKVLADWWPHKRKFRVAGKIRYPASEGDLIAALKALAQ